MIPFESVTEARSLIQAYIQPTPLVHLENLDKIAGRRLLLKAENFQRTGSFKIRGAANFALHHLAEAKKKGIVAASAGNHSQGVAAICSELGVESTIVMPTFTPAVKIENTKRWGAKVVLYGKDLDEALAHAKELSESKHYLLAHAFHDPLIMAGHGTLALELMEEEDFDKVEAIVVSVGGGGLISGCIAALKKHRPDIKIYGVSAQNAPGAWLTYHGKQPPDGPLGYTLAEGVALKRPLKPILDYLKENLEDFFCIGEEAIAHAVSLLAEYGKMVVEGAGALPLAAVLEGHLKEKNIALIVSGGNIDPSALSRVLQRGMVEQGRLARLLIKGPDRPGMLHGITKVLAEMQANVIQVQHTRGTLEIGVGDTQIEVDIETRSSSHTEEIIAKLEENALRVKRVY